MILNNTTYPEAEEVFYGDVLNEGYGQGQRQATTLSQVLNGTITELTADDLYGLIKMRPYAGLPGLSLLVSIEFPNTLTSIGTSGISGATNLSSVKFIGNFNHLTVGRTSFENCSSLESFQFPVILNTTPYNSRIYALAFNNCTSLKLLDLTKVNGIVTLDNINAFSGVHQDFKVVVPDNLYSSYLADSVWSQLASGTIVRESDYQGG